MRFIVLFCVLFLCITPAQAQDTEKTSCTPDDTACLFELLETETDSIKEDHWRDSTYREMAKLLTHAGETDKALTLIDKIKAPDTQAMTIRGIGMAATETNRPEQEFDELFANLREKAETIEHPPSYAIALTYIAMAQAFAGDDEGAMKTAQGMENVALRNKAFAESAEIQAEGGNIEAAMMSIDQIDDPAFYDKAARTVSKIFADGGAYDHALTAGQRINDTYQRAQTLLYVLVKKFTPEEVSVQ